MCWKSVFYMKNKTNTTLLIDNSNTRTKLMFSCDGKLEEELLVLPTSGLSEDGLQGALLGRAFDRVLVSSVVPCAADVFRRAFRVPVKFLSAEFPVGVSFEYKALGTLGADRVANVLGVVESGILPCVAVDLGTAVTFDVVIERAGIPCFVGGAIAPGLSVMCSSLAQMTAQLPFVSATENVCAIGHSTVEGMQSGCLLGLCGQVRELLARIAEELGVKPYVVATGGDAVLVGNMLGCFDKVDALLTFRGLNRAAQCVF